MDAGFLKIRIRDPYVMPKSGSYQVEVSDGSNLTHGILHCFSSADQEDELILFGSVQETVTRLSISSIHSDRLGLKPLMIKEVQLYG